MKKLILLTILFLPSLTFAFTGQEVLTATNKDRATPLVENVTLDSVAQIRANDMAERGYFSHDVDGIKNVYKMWLSLFGYKSKKDGENLAKGFTDVASMEKILMASYYHHLNIVDPWYTEMGVGIATAKDGTIYVAMEFGKPLK